MSKNLLPGAGVLGYGFDILGTYDLHSLTQQIFQHHSMEDSTWQFPPTLITYSVPDNITVTETTDNSGGVFVFNTQQEFQEHFQAKGQLKGELKTSIGAFSGEFGLAYSETLNTNRSYYYGLYEADYTGWQVELADQSREWLSRGFSTDPDIVNLPSEFTPQNQQKFYTVFQKYGTHYVSQVTVGGSFYYYVAVERTYSSNEEEISGNINLEYKAVFGGGGSITADAEWKQLGQNWTSSRMVRVRASGGSADVLNALTPTYGENDQSIYGAWVGNVMTNPAVIDFQLRSLDNLFSGDTARAVKQALSAYLNGAIVANANVDYTPGQGPGGGDWTTSSSIITPAGAIQPNPPVSLPTQAPYYDLGIPPQGGIQIAILDPVTLQPIMSHIYYEDEHNWEPDTSLYPKIMTDLQAVPHAGYIAVVAAFAVNLMNYPSSAFAGWLSSIGAELSGWSAFAHWTASWDLANYICIGRQGLRPGAAVEAFTRSMGWYHGYHGGVTSNHDTSAFALLYADSQLTSGRARAFGSLVAPVEEA